MNILKNARFQKYIYILNDIALVVGVIVIGTSIDPNLPLAGSLRLHFFTILLAIPLVFGIAAHSMHYLSHRKPRSLSLFIVSKLLLIVSIVSYAYVARMSILDNLVHTTEPAMYMAVGTYLVTAVLALMLPFSKRTSSSSARSDQS